MRIVKLLLLAVLGISLIGAGMYMLMQRFKATPLAQVPVFSQPRFALPKLPQLPKVPEPVAQGFAKVGEMVPKNLQIGNVLGAKKEEETPEPESANAPKVPTHQFAFEKSKYEYCKGVVTDFEQRYMSTPKPEAE